MGSILIHSFSTDTLRGPGGRLHSRLTDAERTELEAALGGSPLTLARREKAPTRKRAGAPVKSGKHMDKWLQSNPTFPLLLTSQAFFLVWERELEYVTSLFSGKCSYNHPLQLKPKALSCVQVGDLRSSDLSDCFPLQEHPSTDSDSSQESQWGPLQECLNYKIKP